MCNVERKIIASGQIKQLYRYISSCTSKSVKSNSTVIDLQNKVHVSDKDRANALAYYFQSNFVADDGISHSIDQNSIVITVPFSPIAIDPSSIMSLIDKWKTSFSRTPDGLPMHFLKKISTAIASPLSVIYNRSIMTGEVPFFWKWSSVIPLPKGDPSNSTVSNYRPVSITTFPCRVLEKILVKYILEFALGNNLIPEEQHGFLKNRSRETAILCSLNDWTLAVEKKQQVDIVYFDFAKAFDRVSHKKLVSKLREMHFPSFICKWIENWLSDRKMFVRVGSSISDVIDCSSGVPQGSVLGPILFSLFTSDLATALRNLGIRFVMYADDIKIYNSIITPSDRMLVQQAINLVHEWSIRFQLPLAPHKCQALYIGSANPKVDYMCNNVVIDKVTQLKDLGFIITDNLCFSKHITFVCGQARKRMFALFRTLKTNKANILVLAYSLYVRSILESGSVVFNPYKKRDKLSLERVQRMFTKRIFMRSQLLNYNDTPSSSERATSLKLDSLENRRKRADGRMLRKILDGKCGLYLKSLYKFRHSTLSSRRGQTRIIVPRVTRNIRRHSFVHRTSLMLERSRYL